jgi:hypothetical protein
MLDMSTDSGKFKARGDIEAKEDDGWLLVDADGVSLVPLYEAKLMWHFDHRFSSYALRAPGSRDTELPRLTDAMHDDPRVEAAPRYWVDQSQVREKLGNWDRDWMLGWRDITGPALNRTLVPCVLPTAGMGDTILLALPSTPDSAFLLHAAWSSLACDYVTRQKTTGIHLKYFIMKQVAVPTPEMFQVAARWLETQMLSEWIRPYVVELTYTSHRLAPYASEMGDEGSPFRWDADRRAILQAELDGAFMHIYGYQRPEVEHILGTFRTLAASEVRVHGEYRTGRLVLDAYDRLQDAIDGRAPWRTAAGAAPGQGLRHE